jgi:hypothetical protein
MPTERPGRSNVRNTASRIPGPFELGPLEVSQAQWEAVIKENPYELDRSNPCYDVPGCGRGSRGPSIPPRSRGMTTEVHRRAEPARPQSSLQVADRGRVVIRARAGTTTRYSFGNSDADLAEYAWFGGDFQIGGTHPVGKRHRIHRATMTPMATSGNEFRTGTTRTTMPAIPPRIRPGSWRQARRARRNLAGDRDELALCVQARLRTTAASASVALASGPSGKTPSRAKGRTR